jgi:hypothetical protein
MLSQMPRELLAYQVPGPTDECKHCSQALRVHGVPQCLQAKLALTDSTAPSLHDKSRQGRQVAGRSTSAHVAPAGMGAHLVVRWRERCCCVLEPAPTPQILATSAYVLDLTCQNSTRAPKDRLMNFKAVRRGFSVTDFQVTKGVITTGCFCIAFTTCTTASSRALKFCSLIESYLCTASKYRISGHLLNMPQETGMLLLNGGGSIC